MVAIKGNQVEARPSTGGPTEMKHVKHVKYILLSLQIGILNKYLITLPLEEKLHSE